VKVAVPTTTTTSRLRLAVPGLPGSGTVAKGTVNLTAAEVGAERRKTVVFHEGAPCGIAGWMIAAGIIIFDGCLALVITLDVLSRGVVTTAQRGGILDQRALEEVVLESVRHRRGAAPGIGVDRGIVQGVT